MNKITFILIPAVLVWLLPTGTLMADTLIFEEGLARLGAGMNQLSQETVDLIVDTNLFGPGGIASGVLRDPSGGDPHMPVFWQTRDPHGDPEQPAPNGQIALAFWIDSLDPLETIGGVEPVPFDVFVHSRDLGTTLGRLDFSAVTGNRGSLHLENVRFIELGADGNPTGVEHDIAPFDIQNIPEPVTLGMMVAGVLAGLRRRAFQGLDGKEAK